MGGNGRRGKLRWHYGTEEVLETDIDCTASSPRNRDSKGSEPGRSNPERGDSWSGEPNR